MKIGLFLALLVLLASTNVFGQGSDEKQVRPDSTETGSNEINQESGNVAKTDKVIINSQGDDGKPTRTRVDFGNSNGPTKSVTVVQGGRRRGRTGKGKVPATGDNKKITTTIIREEVTKPDAAAPEDASNTDTGVQRGTGSRTRTKPRVNTSVNNQNSDAPVNDQNAGAPVNSQNSDAPVNDQNAGAPVSGQNSDAPVNDQNAGAPVNDQNSDVPANDQSGNGPVPNPSGGEPVVQPEGPQRPTGGAPVNGGPAAVTDGSDNRPPESISANSVHVRGNIVLVKYDSSVIGSVQYDIDGERLINPDRQPVEARLPFAQDFLSRRSRITLYVATSKTTDPNLAFAKFPIRYKEDHFPISFNVQVDLPDQQRGLLERADITLYFFVYIHNHEIHTDTFIPAGTSQILLQGTNRLVQKLDVYVRASGIEIVGLFRGRFSQRFIRPDTSFQVFIVPEQSLALLDSPSMESVAQLTINNAPAMFPVPFSLLVRNQMLKANTKYFAIGYVYENGIRHMINQEPIYVISEEKVLVTPQVIFTVIPSPFILRGVVTRSMPGSFFLQPSSSLILRIHEIGSDSRDIIFKLPEIITLPQPFQINISQAIRFNPAKNYDIRALITDGKNDIYMASLQPIPLPDEFSKLIIPVDDLLYYVQVHLQPSSNQLLSYVPGSTAQIFVTESPESPTKPIVALRIDSLAPDFRDFSLQVPATAIQRGRNYYLVMMIENNGIITHVSKILLISNNQPPPLVVQLPVLSLNLISGVIFDVENRPAQWSSSSFASLYLLDDKAVDPNKAVVQVWKIQLENDFPVRFEIQLDFSRLQPNHVYRLQAAIENGRNVLEYKPAGSVLALNPNAGIITDVRIPVQNVKTFQIVSGLVYVNGLQGPLPERSEIIVQLSSSPSLISPSIIDEIHINVEGRTLPVDFTMKLPLNKVDINAVYYFLVRYVVRDNVVIPSSQAFAFSPRNEATVVLTLSKTPQIPITGQVTSTGSPLILPDSSTLHLYITDNSDVERPTIFSEVFIKASPNSLYEFTMNIDSTILQKKIPLYLRADILYDDTIILSIPRPALLQITPGGQWNINLVVDLPTLLIGQIVSMNPQEPINGEFDVFIQILERGTNNIVHTARVRLAAALPQKYRVQIDNDLFFRYPALQARAVIKNCKEQTLFESGGAIAINPGLNIQIDLPVVLTDRKRLTALTSSANDTASIHAGVWRLSVSGVVIDKKLGAVTDLNNKFVLQK